MHASQILIALLVAPTMLFADPDPAPPKPDAEVLKVVTLTNTRANNVMAAIHELGFPTRSTVLDENRLVLRGTAEDVQLVLEQLVAKIDIPAVSPGSASTIDYIQLSQQPSSAFMSLIEAVAPRDFGTHYALDPAGRLMVVNAPKEQVVAIRHLIASMDKPAGSFLIHFYFLRAKAGAEKSAANPETMPKELVPIVRNLKSSGFGDFELIAPLVIQAVDGEHFQSKLGELGDKKSAGDSLGIEVRGRPTFDKAAQVVRLELNVRLEGRRFQTPAQSSEAVANPIELTVESVLAAELDDCVVLAAAPSSKATADAAAVVVKITQTAPSQP